MEEGMKMTKRLKLAAIHARTAPLPEEANPYSVKYDPAAPGAYVEANTGKILELLHRAGQAGADLVCTQEDFRGEGAYLRYLDQPDLLPSLAEQTGGPVSRRIAAIAGRYGMNIAVNSYEKDGDSLYNTTHVYDRQGSVAGKYRKVHLPPSEKWQIKPGREFNVVPLDIGTAGFCTCYDIIFPEHCRLVALNGADIIVHQTMGWGVAVSGNGDELVRIRAAENSVYLVAAKNRTDDDGRSCIVDPTGAMLAKAGEEEGLVIAEIEPDYMLYQEKHFNTFYSGVGSVKIRSALERHPQLYALLSDPHPPLLKQHKEMQLSDTPEKIRDIFVKWKEDAGNKLNNRPNKLDYYW